MMQINRLNGSCLTVQFGADATGLATLLVTPGHSFDVTPEEAFVLAHELLAFRAAVRRLEPTPAEVLRDDLARETVATLLASGFLADGVAPTIVAQMAIGAYNDVLAGSTQIQALNRAISGYSGPHVWPARPPRDRQDEIAESEHSDHEGEI